MILKRWKEKKKFLELADQKLLMHLLDVACVISFFMLSWVQIEFSSTSDVLWHILQIRIKYALINILTGCVICMLIYVVVNSFWKSCAVYNILIAVVSVINYYTIKFHGMPLTVSELQNYKTALNVIGGYDIDIFDTAYLLIFLLIEIVVWCIIKRLRRMEQRGRKSNRRLIKTLCICSISFFLGYFVYLAPVPIVDVSLGWSWKETYYQYGYLACTISRAIDSNDFLEKPDGYRYDHISNIEIIKEDKVRNRFPDIILILNESFYDLSLIADFETDVPYLKNISNMNHIMRGYTVVPGIGGGTNSSEYELLTSNSLQLMQGIVPFNVIDMNGANSIVSHLKQLGYYTVGMHSEPALNYNRGNTYLNMGFDRTFFEDEFVDKTYYDNRCYESDECLYNNLLFWMEEYDESPHFTYLVTIQNHGGWEMNERDSDVIHAMKDFGGFDAQVDEYLSCIALSDLAFSEFVNELENWDREVIVCMVGDHCPYFASSIVDEQHKKEQELLLTCTPFVIWANYDIEEGDIGVISMNYLVPTLLDVAGVNLSPYYQYMLNLRQDVPVLTSWNAYYDKQMTQYSYDAISDYTIKINDYFYLEYNNLQDDRRQELFDAY